MNDLNLNYAFIPHKRDANKPSVDLMAILALSAQLAPGEKYNVSRDGSG